MQPDGWDVDIRIGVLTPAADVGPECELRAMAPVRVGIHAARVPFAAMGPGGAMDPTIALQHVRAFADPPGVDDAVGRLADARTDVIRFGFTSSSYVIAPAGEAAMVERLMERSRGIPVITACAASVDALGVLGASRVTLFSPPWFDSELNRLGRRYYEDAGVEVVDVVSCPLPSDQRAITPAGLHAAITEHVADDADAVVIGGNGFRAVGAIVALGGLVEPSRGDGQPGAPVVGAQVRGRRH